MSNANSPSKSPVLTTGKPEDADTVNGLVNAISDAAFASWLDEKNRTENILQGKSFFNGPAKRPDPERHKPSQLLRCPRLAVYRRRNAPKESRAPNGLFWAGSEIEEQIVVPFLQAVTPEDIYLQNSMWVDETIDDDVEESLVVRGVTDPVLVTGEAEPLVVTEVKSTTSVEHRSSPSKHHRAQLMSYLYALNQQHDHTITGILLYLDRETFELKSFYEEFAPEFWHGEVVPWMVEITGYEQRDELPPASPLYGWECEYCDYRHRCGQTDKQYSDVEARGFLPLTLYPRGQIKDHLAAHDDVALTPTLANHFQVLAEQHEVAPWQCPSCEGTYEWDSVDWDGDVDQPPVCPACTDAGVFVVLRGPRPETGLRLGINSSRLSGSLPFRS